MNVPEVPVTLRDVLTLLALAALWGGSFLFIKLAAPVLGPFGLALASPGCCSQASPLPVLAFEQCVLRMRLFTGPEEEMTGEAPPSGIG